jgi:hypothetical protein
MARQMDPAKLPAALRPFLPLFEKWGNVSSDSGRYALADRAETDPAEMQELLNWHAQLVMVDWSSLQDWWNGPISPLTENFERAKVYFTSLLLYGELEIQKRFPPPPNQTQPSE